MVSWFVAAVAACVRGALEVGVGREAQVLECLCGGRLGSCIARGQACDAAHRRIGLESVGLGIEVDDAEIVDGMWPGDGRVREVQQVRDFAQGRGWPCVHGQRAWQGPSRAKVGERAAGQSGAGGVRTGSRCVTRRIAPQTELAALRQSPCLPTSSWAWLAMLPNSGTPSPRRRTWAAWPGAPSRAYHGRRRARASRVTGEECGVGRLGYLTVGKHAVEWRAARDVSASGSTYAPTTRHRMWARELDVTHADVAHANGGHTSETRIVPNVYRGAGCPCSAHARTYPLAWLALSALPSS